MNSFEQVSSLDYQMSLAGPEPCKVGWGQCTVQEEGGALYRGGQFQGPVQRMAESCTKVWGLVYMV